MGFFDTFDPASVFWHSILIDHVRSFEVWDRRMDGYLLARSHYPGRNHRAFTGPEAEGLIRNTKEPVFPIVFYFLFPLKA